MRFILVPALAAILTLNACAPAQLPAATITEASVTRTPEGLALTWTADPAAAPVDVYLVSAAGAETLVSDDDADGAHLIPTEAAAARPLVRVVGAEGVALTVAERLLPLEGGRNFRDLGGYVGHEGRRVRWGLVFRSGTMARLTAADQALIRGLGVTTICDFRANEERLREPTDWAAIDPELVYRSRDYITDSSGLRDVLRNPQAAPADISEAMRQFYGEIAYTHAESYRVMFQDVIDGRLPLAFNCSAGKDRTGMAAALMLHVLGVDREIILQDYALSEEVVDYERAYRAPAPPAAEGTPNPWAFIAALSPEQRAPLLRSDPAYLAAAFALIETREGSVDAYLERVLGVDRADVAIIRDRLLEAAS